MLIGLSSQRLHTKLMFYPLLFSFSNRSLLNNQPLPKALYANNALAFFWKALQDPYVSLGIIYQTTCPCACLPLLLVAKFLFTTSTHNVHFSLCLSIFLDV